MAADTLVSNADVFTHMRIINGMGISLCLSRLLVFASKFIQHPDKHKVSYIHIGWVLIVFMWIIQFWWDYLIESNDKTYDVITYILELSYVFGLFFICVTLTPDDVKEYGDYENYFFLRKIWLFSFFIFINTIQSVEEFRTTFVDDDYVNMIAQPLLLALETLFIVLAMRIERKNFQYVLIGLLCCTIVLDFAI